MSTPKQGVALVTGGASGIGLATARALAKAGHVVAINHMGRASEALAAANEFGAVPFEADVTDLPSVASMFDAIAASLGPIAVLVCSAGVSGVRALEEIDDQLWQRMLQVNLGGTFNVVRSAVPAMRKLDHAAIVTISSELALTGAAQRAHYVSAKAALIGFTKSVSRELASDHITVNCVAPGPTDTDLLSAQHRAPAFVNTIPLGRLGRPQEVAETVVHLAHSRWTTGQVVSPNGGTVIQ